MERRPAFDERERDRIRRLMLRYKEDHAVGVPRLQLRIAEALGDNDPDRVPLKSLQRFLAATHRTDDALVDHCLKFLMRVAPPPAEEPLAEALRQFLGIEQVDEQACPPWTGDYNGWLVTGAPDDRWRRVVYSRLALSAAAHPHYLRAVETVLNEERDTHPFMADPRFFDAQIEGEAVHYEGLLMPYASAGMGPSFIGVLRNYVHMRVLMLRPAGEGAPDRLEGDVAEPPRQGFMVMQRPDGEREIVTGYDRSIRMEFERRPSNEEPQEGVSKS